MQTEISFTEIYHEFYRDTYLLYIKFLVIRCIVVYLHFTVSNRIIIILKYSLEVYPFAKKRRRKIELVCPMSIQNNNLLHIGRQ